MQRVEIGLEDSFTWGGGVLISTINFLPTVPPSHAQKNGFKGPIKENNKLGGDTIAKDGTYRGGRRVKA